MKKLTNMATFVCVMTIFILSAPKCVLSMTLESLYEQLEQSNREIKLAKKRVEFRRFGVDASKSPLYPSFKLNAGINKGKEIDNQSLSSASSSQVSSSGGGSGGLDPVASDNSPGDTASLRPDAWSVDLGMSYVLFAKYSISTNIKNSKNSLMSDTIDLQMIRENKKSQVVQLVLEINALKDIIKTLNRANRILSKLKKKSIRGRNNYLYSKDESLKLETRYHEVVFQKTRAQGALNLAYQALKDIIPTYVDKWSDSLPKLTVDYPLPTLEMIKVKFLQNSPKIKQYDLTIDSFSNIYNSTRWERPWIPAIGLTSSFSKSGKYEGKSNVSDSWSVAAILTFNIFDGFYSSARIGQAQASLQMTKVRKKLEISKALVSLAKDQMECSNAKAKYQFKRALARQKMHKVDTLKEVAKAGSSTSFEQSIMLLDHAHAQFEAFTARRRYQQGLIKIASSLQEFNKVKIDETKI
ncbi:MAG: TolC family protein [Bacteriovoracaceae bacterium]|nr:TolC family protein [Bacteriovoracaceae bacterium]